MPLKPNSRRRTVDRIKIIATLKWVHDILRELHFTDVLEDIDDCIMMLKKEQQASTLRECDVHECRRKVREADDDSSLAGAIIYRR
jgi:hypothetical protein